MSWLQEKYPQEGMSKKDNTNTHIHYIQKCKNKKALPGKKGYWDHSVRLYYDYIGSLYGKTMTSAVHPTENRFLNIRELLHLMGMPHEFEIDNPKNYKHIAQVRQP